MIVVSVILVVCYNKPVGMVVPDVSSELKWPPLGCSLAVEVAPSGISAGTCAVSEMYKVR